MDEQYAQPQPGLAPPPPMGGMMPPGPAPMMGGGGASNEELIEAIIDEKWNELVKDIAKIAEWKAQAESKISAMEQEIKDMRAQFDKLHQGVIGKIGEYDKHILDVGAEIQAMEKVFAKVLPVFTETVSELSRVSDDMKQTLGKK